MADEAPAFDPAQPFEPVGAAAPEFDPDKPFEDAAPQPISGAALPLVKSSPGVVSVLEAFGQGFAEGFGPERLGISDANRKWLVEKNILPRDANDYRDPRKPFMAFNEAIILPLAAGIDAAIRAPNALYHGLGDVGLRLGVPQDIVAMPEAFMGTPHPMGVPRVAGEVPGIAMEKPAADAPPPPKYQLVRDTTSAGGEMQKSYEIRDEQDRPIGGATFTMMGRVAKLENIEAEGGPGAIGPSALRGLLRQFRKDNPEVTEITAERISGARFGGDTVYEGDHVSVPLGRFAPVLDLGEARDLGVIGPPKPPLAEGPPAEAAARTVAADQAPPETVTSGDRNPWQQRFDQFVGKLAAPDDVKQLIRDAAAENGDFMPARQGDIPLSHVEGIAEAAGVAPEEINTRGLGRTLRNDQEVRVAMQMMLQVTDNVKTAARDVKADGSPESLIRLQEAIMRRDLAVEQVVGLRAEWGRTGNVIQEFMRDVKDQEGLSNFLKDKKGRSPGDLRDLADAIDALDGPQAARMLNDARTPGFWDKFKWYWVNALISGPVTHLKYIGANAAFATYESAVVTPIAGAVGTLRRATTGTREGVFVGEAAARLWGLVAGTPDAISAAVRAGRTGMQTPLPGEIAQGVIPKQNRNITFQQKPIEGPLGTAIGIPSRGASAIHSFFNFLGYRASMEAQAYRAAAKDGLKGDEFWQRRGDAMANPTPEMMDAGVDEGYRLTYISELGPAGEKISAAIKATKIGQLLLPFTHIPFNILARGLEGTPAGFLTAETRADLFGKNGAVKQDMATARLIAGSAVGVWAMNLALNDRMTGFGPSDPKERAQWIETGHQPYSIRIGDYWYSFNRFGSLGTMLGLYANLGEVIPHMKPDAEELTKALTMTVHSTGRLLEDEVGMQGLAGLIDAINEPDRKGTRFVSSFAGSLLPYSSALRQTASAMDPYMRETKSVVDGLRYYIPAARQGLLPKRNWLGEPIANAGYGGDLPVPGASAIIQHREGGPDPLALEMKALDLHPAAPQDRIGGVKLTPKLYDIYQATAGPFTRQALEALISQPSWHELPPPVREGIVKPTIEATRKAAAAAVQAAYPEIIRQGVENRINHLSGQKPTKLRD